MKKHSQCLTIKYIQKSFLICFLLALFAGKVDARTFTWKGTGGDTRWENTNNWTFSGSGSPTYPGQGGTTTDVVQIGTTTYIPGGSVNQPTLNASVTVGNITFGGNGGHAMILTINGAVLTAANVTQQHYNGTTGITTTITDGASTGTLICTSLTIGNNTTPSSGTRLTTFNCNINTLTVNGGVGLALFSGDSFSGSKVNNPVLNLNSGTLSTVDITTNDVNGNGTCTFNMNIGATANTLTLTGTSTLQSIYAGTSSNFNFVLGGPGLSTVIYSASGATINTTADASSNGYSVSSPYMYPNLTVSGGGANTVGGNTGGTLSVVGALTTSGGGTITLATNNPAVTVAGNWTNSIGVTEGTGAVSITGNLVNNSGGGVINGSTSSGTTSVTGTLTNSGTITVNKENMTFTGTATNSGTYTGGTGTSTFTTGLTNSLTVTESSGQFTIGNLANNSPGIFTGYSTATATTSVTGTLSNSGTITVNKENMTFTGAATNTGTYTGGAGTSTFSNSFAMSAGTFAASTGAVTFNGTYNNSGGAFTAGTGNVNFNSDYTNSGTFTANTTGNIIFGFAGTQTLTDNSAAGTTFYNVQVQGSGTKTMAGSKGFFVASTGILTMGGTATLAGGGVLTLNSDANSTATVAAIPAGCSITGNVNVQRFIKGSLSSSNLTKRGYRLLTSTVYTGTDASAGNAHVFDFNYLVNSVLLSGAGYAANGFTVTTNENPSIYLFREDDTPPANNNLVFTTGYNWKGVAKINNSPVYNIGTQKSKTSYNVADTTTTIPVGNGFLLYFRGNTTVSNGSTTGSKTTAPFNYPEDVTLTETGTLNTGTINVRLWFANSANNLGNNLSYTFKTTAAQSGSTSSLTGGYTLIGNPYPSTINWEKYNNTHASGAITGSATLVGKIWVFDELSKQYYAYIPALGADITSERPSGSTATGSASNFIASGQAFFIKTSATGQTLSFSETAKISAQPTLGPLSNLMGKPKDLFANQPKPLIRLKLSMDSINTDEIAIRLNNNASTKFVDNEDAEDLGGSGNLLGLAAFSSDSIKLSISSQPFPDLQQQVTRLFTGALSSGLYQLSRTQLDNLPALYDVWLKDAFMKDSLDLKANTTYQFNIDKNNPATFGNDRFTLVIRQNPAYAYRLLDFTAARLGNSSHVEVDWKVENEQNYTNFTVERSIDGGKTFDIVGGLQGSGAGTYSLADKNATTGQNLYRLKQEDINNTITYSKVVEVLIDNKSHKDADNKLSIYPNPATSIINLAIADQSNENASYTIRFMNSSGIVIKQIASSQPSWQGNISDLLPGTYLVRVINNKTQNLIGENKFVKL